MKQIIFYRNTRGIGDAVMLLRTIELWNEREPDAEIIVVTDSPASAVYEQHPHIDEIIPCDKFDISRYNDVRFFNVSKCCLDYEQYQLSTKGKVTKSRFEIFADTCDIEFDDKPGKIHITKLEHRHINDRFRLDYNKNNYGLVWRSAQHWRDYPHRQLLVDLYKRQRRIEPIIIDHEITQEGILSTADLSPRETIALISHLDLVIGPDTGPMHIAASLGIPTLWLFGPTDPEMRAVYYPEANWVTKMCKKGCCWYLPCEDVNCLFNISPWSIIRRAKKILKK